MTMNKSKERNYALDFMKCIATMLVLNSHMDICYPGHEYLATGGAIGNCLFFCISGFLLIPMVHRGGANVLLIGIKSAFAGYFRHF